jgi:type I restriction enzyme M protein
MTTLKTLLKDSAYKLTQFSLAQIEFLEKRIIDKDVRGKVTPHVVCLVRGKEIKLTPEEVVRQLFIDTLNTHYHYSLERMQCEYPVKTGSSSKRADIVIFDAENTAQPYIIVELKQPNVKDGQEQLKSYCRFEGAPLGVWTNGEDIEYFLKNENAKSKTVGLNGLGGLPNANQTLAGFLNEPFTIKNLIMNDKLEHRSLKKIITQFEDVVLANSGADGFEEIFKMIFTKLFDEFQSGSDKDEINALLKHGTPIDAIDNAAFRSLQFRNTSTETDVEKREAEVKIRLEKLFAEARKKWRGIFSTDDSFKLTASHLSTCVSYLQDIKLFNSNLDVIDDAFEYLVNQESKGNKGQYFTPRYVIDMCVKMLNPKSHETMIDTASGSCGFPMHTIFHVWQALAPENTNLFTTDKRTPAQIDYVQNNVFGIDFDARSVRVGRALNLIAGDGQTNVLRLNTLDYKRWDETVKEQSWVDVFNDGFRKLKELRADNESYKSFNFDVLMANPPFAGEITDETLLANYQLGKNATGKAQTKVGRDILFIERNLNFLKSGGRMAVVLPQGRFNNSSDKYIREFIAEHCRILAVVGLHGNVFKPHTGTKTSVLLVQKWDAEICPKVDDYPIFFATMQKQSKDNSGEKIYIKDENGANIKDHHGHFIVDHDLFNHDGLTQDGIAEAFVEFAKKEKLSFFDSSPFDEVKYRALLEGLEISEVMFSDVDLGDRFDAEYFWKDGLVIQKLLEQKGAVKFNEIGEFVASAFYPAATHLYESGDTPFIRCVDCISYPLITREQNHLFENIPLSFANESGGINLLKKGDFVITKVGSPCFASIVEEHELVALSRTVLGVKNVKNVDPYYLLIFLRGRYGFNQLLRQRELTIQYQLTLARVKNIQIYLASAKLQQKIHEIVARYIQSNQQSKSTYSQAETLLLDALGMADFSPSNENINIKSFKDSFLTTGRLDAEYYQPKYEEVMAHISAQNHDKLSALVTIQKSIETGSDAYSEDENGLPYLRVADYNKFGITEPQKRLTDSFIADFFKGEEGEKKLKKLKPKAGTILFSKDGSVGEAFCLQEDANFITSGAVLHLTVRDKEKILPDYLTLALNSKLVKMQSERDAGGSIILHWRVGEIENVIVPIVEMETQTKIAALVQQSFALKAESEMLLELAKRAVEMAIEEDEAAAMGYLENEK